MCHVFASQDPAIYQTITRSVRLNGFSTSIRLEALFWHLADRWGKVTPKGVVVPLRLSHRLLGSLVGARRPTVTTALAQLADDGRVLPYGLEGWLLCGPAPRTPDFDGLGALPLPSAGLRPRSPAPL